MTANSLPPVVLRNGAGIEDPLGVVLGLLKAWRLDLSAPSRPVSFGEPDLRFADRGGARISAAQIAAILERRGAIEDALRVIAPGASLAGPADGVPWLALGQLFGAFAGIGGVAFEDDQALRPKRPALIPMLDSIVQTYLRGDPGARLRSASARSGWSVGISATWSATRWRCGRSGRNLPGAVRSSLRCGSSTC